MAETERQQIEREQIIADLQAVMALPAGRRFMWRLLGDTGVFHSGWSPSAEIHLRAGMRSVGLKYYHEIHEHCFATYQVMEQEAREAAMKRAAQNNPNHEDK